MAGDIFGHYANYRLPLVALYLVAFLRCFSALAVETKTAEHSFDKGKTSSNVLLLLAVALFASLPPFPLACVPPFSPKNSSKSKESPRNYALSQEKLPFLLTSHFFLLIYRHVPFRNADEDRCLPVSNTGTGRARKKHQGINSQQLLTNPFV